MMNHPRGWRLDVSGLDLQDREQSLEWGHVFAAMEALESGEIANPDEHRQVGHYWLRAPDLAPTLGHARAISEAIEAIEEFGDGIRSGSVAATGGLPYTLSLIHISEPRDLSTSRMPSSA